MAENMYPYNIGIDGARADEDQHWRIDRIHMVIGYAQALADLDKNEDFYKKIESIYDQKGFLTVIWRTAPSKEEKEYLQKAWDSVVTDYEGEPIEHDILN